MAVFRTFFHGPITGLELTCLKSFVDHGHRIVLYGYERQQAPDWLEQEDAAGLIPQDQLFFYDNGPGKGSVSAFSNIFRYALCAAYGDWWVDTDVVCLSSQWPEPLGGIAAGREHPRSIGTAVLWLEKSLAARLEDRAWRLGKHVSWGEAGPNLLTRMVEEEGMSGLILPQNAFYPVPLEKWDWVHAEDHRDEVCSMARESFCTHLWNEYACQHCFQKSVRPEPQSFFGQRVSKHDTGGFFQPEEEAQTRGSIGSNLPLLSFIVINYNYGAFLRACVDSIMTQTYSATECIVVDNASTDNSQNILAYLAKRYRTLKIIRNTANIGQSAACRDALASAKGNYVAFIDADDYLLPDFAASHMRAHLTLPYAVGFTSSEMMQMADDKIVRAQYLTEPPGDDLAVPVLQEELRDLRDMRQALGSGELEVAELAANLRMVSSTCTAWVWAPTSGTVYRRDALLLFADNRKLDDLKFATDAYFNFGINALMSSAIIDKALAVYRIHGGNNFSRRATLRGMVTFKKENDSGARAAYLALRHIILNFERFFAQTSDIPVLWSAMSTLHRKASSARLQAGERFALIGLKIYFFLAVRLLDVHFEPKKASCKKT